MIAFALDGSHAFRAAALDPQLVRSLEEARSLLFLHALVAVALVVLVGAFVASRAVCLLLARIVVVGAVMVSQPHGAQPAGGGSS